LITIIIIIIIISAVVNIQRGNAVTFLNTLTGLDAVAVIPCGFMLVGEKIILIISLKDLLNRGQ